MYYPVAAHVEFVKGKHILGIIIANAVIRAEFPLYCFAACKQVCNLNIQLFAPLIAHEVYLPFAAAAYCNGVAAAQQLNIYNVFQGKVYIAHIAAENGLAYAVIGNIILFVGGKYLLAVKILPPDLIEQIGIAAIFYVVKYCFGRDCALLIFQIFCKRRCGKGVAHVCHNICRYALKQIHIAYFIARYNILQLNRIEKVLQILPGGFVGIANIGKIRHTAA